MSDPKSFLIIKRSKVEYRPVCERVKDYQEVVVLPKEAHSKEQSSRCMNCGTPFCHWACPIGNYIPEWNDLVSRGKWQRAFELLSASNNLPEITGRVCPALCEYSCVLGVNDEPVTVRDNELAIIEYAFKHGLIVPKPPVKRTGKKIAVIGSGPAGLSAATQLNSLGHKVIVFEKDDAAGGILRYGIPDFKLEKSILDRRISIWEKEGVEFAYGVNAGVTYSAKKLFKGFDVICLAGGSRVPRDLNIPGRNLKGVHFAMEYLIQANRRVSGYQFSPDELIDARGKKVVVIGGGDTGADCVGVAHRQGASCVIQVEVLPQPPSCRTKDYPWPKYPILLKSSTSHEEGGERLWSVLTKELKGENVAVKKLVCAKVEFIKDAAGCSVMREIPGSGFDIEADLVILALGFLHPEHKGLVEELNLELDNRGNLKTNPIFRTFHKKVFACGDMHRGQSLVVWAIAEGRTAAANIDRFLQ